MGRRPRRPPCPTEAWVLEELSVLVWGSPKPGASDLPVYARHRPVVSVARVTKSPRLRGRETAASPSGGREPGTEVLVPSPAPGRSLARGHGLWTHDPALPWPPHGLLLGSKCPLGTWATVPGLRLARSPSVHSLIGEGPSPNKVPSGNRDLSIFLGSTIHATAFTLVIVTLINVPAL